MKIILFGGSGEVGGAVACELLKSDVCSQLTLLGRRAISTMQDEPKVEQIVLDTSSGNFEEEVKEKAQGHDVAISCIGIGSGTTYMSEEQMLEVEVNMLGKKYKTVLEVGFEKLAVFKPGMIVGNAHTPRWITVFTRFIPDSIGWGNIRQEEVAQAFAIHLEYRVTLQKEPIVSYGNKDMKLLLLDRMEHNTNKEA